MVEIYVVEYHLYDHNCDAIYPLKAFIDERKAEEFVKECQAECLRIEIKVENYWLKHQKEYDELRKIIREKIENRQFKHDLKESNRSVEIMMGEKDIINSHKYHSHYSIYPPAHPKDDSSYEITPLELVK